jgi:hypothetical protein
MMHESKIGSRSCRGKLETESFWVSFLKYNPRSFSYRAINIRIIRIIDLKLQGKQPEKLVSPLDLPSFD